MKHVCAALLLLTAGCAWSNPVNRPVWNAFEEHLVPEQDAAFYATLPLTVPAGIGAILADSLAVHPVMVIDDAAGDASDPWRHLDWQKRYYTELAFLPLRVVTTPLVFAFSWLGRACFDIEPRASRDPAVLAAKAKREAESRRAECLAFLAALEHQDTTAKSPTAAPVEWDAELAAAFERAQRLSSARGRFILLKAARELELPPLIEDPCLGLRDRDPVVRYLELNSWSGKALPADVLHALLTDENEMVRALAAEKSRD